MQIAQHISQTQETVLTMKKQIQKLVDKIQAKEHLKSYQSLLANIIQNAIIHKYQIPQHQAILTLILKFLDVPQQQVCESDNLQNQIIAYIKFLVENFKSDEYSNQCLANLISFIFFSKKICDVELYDIKVLDIDLKYVGQQNKISQIQLQPIQVGLRLKAYNQLQIHEELFKFKEKEIKQLAQELALLHMKSLNSSCDPGSSSFHLLSSAEQLQIICKNAITDQNIDFLNLLVLKEKISEELFIQLYKSLLDSQNINYNKAQLLLQRAANQRKFKLELLQYQNQEKQNFINNCTVMFASNLKELVLIELKKQQNVNLGFLLLSIQPENFSLLFELLISKKINKYQLLILHTTYLLYNIDVDLARLRKECEKFETAEHYVILIFSTYSLENNTPDRKIKILNQFQQLVDDQFDVYTICTILGQSTKNQNHNLQLGQILNQQWNNLSLYLNHIAKNVNLFQGFYNIIKFYSNPKESELLWLYEVVHGAMCGRNRAFNYSKLLGSIQQYRSKNIAKEITLYVMLLKNNYILNDQEKYQKFSEDHSEISSERGQDGCDDKEQQLFEDVIQKGSILQNTIEIKIKQLESLQYQKELQLTNEQTEKLMLEIDINKILKFQNKEYIDALLPDDEFKEGKTLEESIQKILLIPMATSVIQIFKNESEITILKLLAVELNKICKQGFTNIFYRSYDLRPVITLSNLEQLKLNVLKYQSIFQLDDDLDILRLLQKDILNNKLETFAFLLALCKTCGIGCYEGIGENKDLCINKQLVKFCRLGFIQIVLLIISKKKRKGKQKQMELEVSGIDFDNLDQEIDNTLTIIKRALTINDDMRQEFLKLAQIVYSQEQSDYEMILKLFNNIPPSLPYLCIQSPGLNDAKLNHLINLLQKIKNLDEEFFKIAYDVLCQTSLQSQAVMNFAFQLINMIRQKEDQQQIKQKVLDYNKLTEILIPEQASLSGCTKQMAQQHFFQCYNCPSFGKTIEICSSCAFGCHKSHNVEYDIYCQGYCDCGKVPKKCTQIKQQVKKSQHKQLLFDIIQSSHNELRDVPLLHRNMYSLMEQEKLPQLWEEEHSDIDIIEQGSSSLSIDESLPIPQLDMNDESSNQSIQMKIEPVFQQQDENIKPQSIIDGFDKHKLMDKLLKLLGQQLQSQNNIQNPIQQKQEFILQKQTLDGQIINHIVKDRQQLKIDIEIYQDLRRQIELFSNRYQIQGQPQPQPFMVRKMIDESDNLIVVGNQQYEMRVYSKQKMLADKKNPSLPFAKIPCKLAISSLQFNPFNNKQLLVTGHQDVNMYELKADGTVVSEKHIIQKLPQIIAKTLWIGAYSIATLAMNYIIVSNLQTSIESQYTSDEKIKDFCVYKDTLYAFDFNGDIVYHKINDSGKYKFVNKLNIPEELKGKNKTSFCLSLIPQTNIFLISYKGGSSFLCNIHNQNLQNIQTLDQILNHLGIDSLLSSPQLISQNQSSIQFTGLVYKHNHSSQQLCLHKGKLTFFELHKSGQLNVQQITDNIVDSYIIFNDTVLALLDIKPLLLISLNTKQPIQYEVKQTDNYDQLLSQLKELLTLKVLSSASSILKPQQNFCLSPNITATQQQYLVQPTSISVSSGYAITGIIFVKSQTEQVEIFRSRKIKRKDKSQNLNVALNQLETIYTLLNHTIDFTPVVCQTIQVQIQKLGLPKQMLQNLISFLNSDNRESKGYIYQHLDAKVQKLKPHLNEQQINIVNCLDCVGITLESISIKIDNTQIIGNLIELMKSQQLIISSSAKKLLKLLLTKQEKQFILGEDYNYKTVRDKIFFERIKDLSNNLVLSKLKKLSLKRLPQLFYLFNQNPTLIYDLLQENVNYSVYIYVLLRFIQYNLNCKGYANNVLQKVDQIKQGWSLSAQNNFNKILKEEIQYHRQASIDECDFAWNIFQQQKEEEELLPEFLDYDIDGAMQEQYIQAVTKPKDVILQKTKSITIENYDMACILSNYYISNLSDAMNQPKEGKDFIPILQQIDILIAILKYFCSNQQHQYARKIFNLMFKEIAIQSQQPTQKSICLIMIYNLNKHNWWDFIKAHQLIDIDCIKKYLLNQIKVLPEEFHSHDKDKLGPLMKELLRNSYDCMAQIAKILTCQDEILYVETLKLLLHINIDQSWTPILCLAKLNHNVKQLAGPILKDLFHKAIRDQNYHKVKDFNLYNYNLETLQQNMSYYSNRQKIYNAINEISKYAQKRPKIWKQFTEEQNAMDLLKKAVKFAPQCLELIEQLQKE